MNGLRSSSAVPVEALNLTPELARGGLVSEAGGRVESSHGDPDAGPASGLNLPGRCLLGWGLILMLSADSSAAATNIVRMVNYAFQPQFLTNEPGDTVIWTNTTLTGHNVVSTDGAWSAPPLFTRPGTFRLTFTNAGTYAYYCSPHRLLGMTGIIYVRAQNQAPSVALTNPTSGITLAAPATVTLKATASDADGTLAGVQFFSGPTALGTVASAPYFLTVSNLPAAVYDFTARAEDNAGLTATSEVVRVTVVAPSAPWFTTAGALEGSQLALSLTVTPGLSYEISTTMDLSNWMPFTNFVADQAVMHFLVPTTGTSQRFFRARLLPNP